MIEQLNEALSAHQIPLPPSASAPRTGEFLRWGKNNRYWLKQGDGVALFGDWIAGASHHYFEDSGQKLNPTEIEARKARLAALKREADAERQRQQEEAAAQAVELWKNLLEVGSSPYLTRKQVAAYGVRFEGETMVVPLRGASGRLWSLQKIHPDGQRRFFPGGRVSGCFHIIGSLEGAIMAYVVEGYATGATVHLATGCPVIVAFNAGNLEPVIAEIRKAWPALQITIAADNDQWTEGNPGKSKAEETARKHGCKVVLPVFPDQYARVHEGEKGPSDFNDLGCLAGIEAVKAQLLIAEATQAKPSRLNAVTLHDFLSREIPETEMLLDPIIPRQGLAMLAAWRGIGKTHVALGIAYAVASGSSFLAWHAPRPARVLLVDGEMPARVQQERLARVVADSDKEPPEPDFLRIITPDFQERGIPDLSSKEGQDAIEEWLEGVDLVILDNLSTLCRSGKENEGEAWLPVQEWALSLRRRGKSVLFVHHNGKNGQQRGTSRREDVLDTVISLVRPSDYETEQGARFEVRYEKGRHLFGKDAEPFEAWLKVEDGSARWEVKDLADSDMERVVELASAGDFTQRDIAAELGISKTRVNRLMLKAKEEGKLPAKPLSRKKGDNYESL